jgi:hypothetical protein
MDIKELDKKQLILLTLLITFVVSIATGIVTVSLMNQMPKNVPQTINNVIQRTIEKVTTVEVPVKVDEVVKDQTNIKNDLNSLFEGNNAMVSIYKKDVVISTDATRVIDVVDNNSNTNSEPLEAGQGIIISDVGLILVDSEIIKDQESYKVVLDKTDFDVSVMKRFNNGFTILKIFPVSVTKPADATIKTL